MSESAATIAAAQDPHPGAVAEDLREGLYQFLLPLLLLLDAHLDVRLVRTLLATVEAMIRFRNRAHGLLLSELGAFLLSLCPACSGCRTSHVRPVRTPS